MSLAALRYDPVFSPKPKRERVAKKEKPKTLMAHLEFYNGYYRVLDLSNKQEDFPPAIVTGKWFDYSRFCNVIQKYMKSRGFTSFTLTGK